MLNIVVADLYEGFVSYAVYMETLGGPQMVGSGVVNGNFLEPNSAVRAQIREAVLKLAPRPDHITILLPRSIAQVTSVAIPARNEEMAGKMMEFEVPRHFPVPPDQLRVAYFMAGSADGKYLVNLAGIRRSDYEKWVGAFTEAGLPPDTVSVSSSAWFDPEGPVADKRCVIEIAPQGFAVNLIQGRRIMYSRYTRFRSGVDEGSFFHDAWSADAATSEVASQIADECGKLDLVSGISGTANYLASTRIVGGGSLQKGVALALGEKAQFKGGNISLPDFSDRQGFGQIARAHGKAGAEPEEGRFDFIPKESRRNPYRKRRAKLLAGAGLLSLLLAAWGGLAYEMQKSRLDNLNAELDRLKAAATSTEKMLVKAEEVQAALAGYMEFSRRKTFTLEAMAEITATVPKDTNLTDIEARGSSLVIAGISGKASALVPILEGSPLFKDVRMIGAVTSTGGGEKFKIGMELE